MYIQAGRLGNVLCTLEPSPLCPHTGNDRLAMKISRGGNLTDFVYGYRYKTTVYDGKGKDRNGNEKDPWLDLRNEDLTATTTVDGIPCAEISVTPVVGDLISKKQYANGSVTILVHLCPGNASHDTTHRNTAPTPGDPNGERPHKQLIIDGEPDRITVDFSDPGSFYQMSGFPKIRDRAFFASSNSMQVSPSGARSGT